MHLIGLRQRVSGALPREEPWIFRDDVRKEVKRNFQIEHVCVPMIVSAEE
jgi:hypothetical protein